MARFENMRLQIKPHWSAPGGILGWQQNLVNMNDADIEARWYFQTQEPDTITHVGVSIETVQSPPTYRISLRNISADGTPAVDPIVQQTFVATTTGFQFFELNSPLQVGRGQFLCLVLDYHSGTIGSSNRIRIWNAITNAGPRLIFPYTSSTDAGGAETKSPEWPVFAYKSLFRTYGLPLEDWSHTAFNNPAQQALRMWLNPGFGSTFQIVGAQIHGRLSQATGKSVDMILYQGGATITELQRVTIDTDIRGSSSNDEVHDFLFDDATLSTLSMGTEYLIAFEPQEADTNFSLRVLELPSAADMTALPGSAAFYYAERASDAVDFTPVKTKRPMVEPIITDWTL